MKTPARVAALAVTALVLAGTATPAFASGSPGPVVSLADAGVATVWPALPAHTPQQLPAVLQGRALTTLSVDTNEVAAVTADGHVLYGGRPDVTVFGSHATAEPAGLDHVTDAEVVYNGGFGNVLALRDDGTVVAWGSTVTGVNEVPAGLTGVKAIALAGYAAYAIRGDGTVVAWGSQAEQPPPGLSGVTAISAASAGGEVLALTSDHTVVAWGSRGDTYGQQDIPAAVQGHAVQIRSQAAGAAALLADGTVVEWGGGNFQSPPPAPPAGDPYVDMDVNNIGCGIAATQSGAVATWGSLCPTTPPAALADEHVVAVAVGGGTTGYYALTTALAVGATPVVTGTAKSGQTLTLASDATFSDSPGEVSTQWLADGDPINGATGHTLALTDALVGKTITLAQIATKDGDTATATSDPIGPVQAPTSLTAAASGSAYGTPATITVSASPATATGAVQVKNGDTLVGSGTLAGGRAAVTIPGTALTAGAHTLTIHYAGDRNDAAATTTVSVSIAKANATLAAKVKPKKLTKAKLKKAKAKVTLTTHGYTPTGTVMVYLKHKVVATATLSNGKATLKLKKLQKLAKNKLKLKLQISYGGDANTNNTTTNATLKLKR